jgi:hypothetical protein
MKTEVLGTLSEDTEEMLEKGLRKLFDKYEVHLAFYLSSLKKLRNMSREEREELRGFLRILINQTYILDLDEEFKEIEEGK